MNTKTKDKIPANSIGSKVRGSISSVPITVPSEKEIDALYKPGFEAKMLTDILTTIGIAEKPGK